MTEYSFFSKICLLNKDLSCSRRVCYTYKNYCFLYCKKATDLSNCYCWHYAHSLQRLLWMQTVPCATGSLAWEGLRGSLGRTVAAIPWNQSNTVTKLSRAAVGAGETVPLDAHLLGMFRITGHLQIFSVSHPCFRCGPLPVITGLRRAVWPRSVFSVPTGPNFLTICNTPGTLVLCSR